MQKVLVLADDLTGALEVGSSFAQRGLESVVYLTLPKTLDKPVSVINMATRTASATELRRQYESLKPYWPFSGLIYKKIDSTLRGPIGEELEQLYLAGHHHFVIAPAYSALGRTTSRGLQYVNGIPVNQTAAAKDPLNPVKTAVIRDLLSPDMQQRAKHLSRLQPEDLSGEGILIVDAQKAEDLEGVAAVLIKESYAGVMVGSNGLASALANYLTSQVKALALPKPATVLIVSGSKHPLSHAQLDQLKNQSRATSDKLWLIESSRLPEDALVIQQTLLSQTAHFLETTSPDAFLVIGGETSLALLKHIGAISLQPQAELSPGIPLSLIQGGKFDGIPIITKSGGFGNLDVLSTILDSFLIKESL